MNLCYVIIPVGHVVSLVNEALMCVRSTGDMRVSVRSLVQSGAVLPHGDLQRNTEALVKQVNRVRMDHLTEVMSQIITTDVSHPDETELCDPGRGPCSRRDLLQVKQTDAGTGIMYTNKLCPRVLGYLGTDAHSIKQKIKYAVSYGVT